jgi:hypothetical protein
MSPLTHLSTLASFNLIAQCAALLSLICLPTALLAQGYDDLTQCFRAKETAPCEKWAGGHDFCRHFFATYPLDQRRACYGQRWSIPTGYYLRKYIAYKPITEVVVIRVARPSLAAGREIPKSEVNSLFHDISIRPLWAHNFDGEIAHVLETQKSFGLVKTGKVMFGLDMYDVSVVPVAKQKEFRNVYLVPPKAPQFLVACPVRPQSTIEKKGPKSSCHVTSNVDDRVQLAYDVRFEEMAEIEPTNQKLVVLVRSWMN